MIYFLTTASHMYTHGVIAEALPQFKQLSYPAILARRSLPCATYIFSDVDRLSPWQLELAARLYQQLKAGGAQVVNDPARVLHRLPLLKKLHRQGINSFQVWEAAEADMVDRFPVFIRTRFAHRGVLSDLLQDADALRAELEQALDQGFTMSDLIIVEFRAQAIRPGLFRKHSVYRIGPHYVGSTSVHETSWMAKIGQMGIADQALYDEEFRDIVEGTHVSAMARVFDVAAIEYGRVDFGMVDSQAEIYEVNTNPQLHAPGEHPFPVRVRSGQKVFDDLIASFASLDQAPGGRMIHISAPAELKRVERRYHLFPGYQWQP